MDVLLGVIGYIIIGRVLPCSLPREPSSNYAITLLPTLKHPPVSARTAAAAARGGVPAALPGLPGHGRRVGDVRRGPGKNLIVSFKYPGWR